MIERTYRVSDVVNEEFLRFPLTLLANPQYREISLEAKFVYTLLLNRLTLSQKNGWIGLFLFLQRLNLQQPPADDRLGRTACVDEMLDAFLVLFDVALVVDIKFLGHFLALASVVHHKHTVAHYQPTAQVVLADGGNIVLQQIQLRQIRVGDKVQVAFNADFVGLHSVELILDHRVHVVEGVAGTIPFIEGECPPAVFLHVHIRIVGFAFAEHGFGSLVEDDIGELFSRRCFSYVHPPLSPLPEHKDFA